MSFFQNKEYGIDQLNFECLTDRKNILITRKREQAKYLSWLLTKRIQPEAGFYVHPPGFFVQSDRWWLEKERIVEKTCEQWLNLEVPHFHLGEQRKSKFFFVNELGARSFLHTPVYKLSGTNLIKFTLLSALFQQTGLVCFSEILHHSLQPPLREVLDAIIGKSNLYVFFIGQDLPVFGEEKFSDYRRIIL